jgi:hypothetical protein
MAVATPVVAIAVQLLEEACSNIISFPVSE